MGVGTDPTKSPAGLDSRSGSRGRGSRLPIAINVLPEITACRGRPLATSASIICSLNLSVGALMILRTPSKSSGQPSSICKTSSISRCRTALSSGSRKPKVNVLDFSLITIYGPFGSICSLTPGIRVPWTSPWLLVEPGARQVHHFVGRPLPRIPHASRVYSRLRPCQQVQLTRGTIKTWCSTLLMNTSFKQGFQRDSCCGFRPLQSPGSVTDGGPPTAGGPKVTRWSHRRARGSTIPSCCPWSPPPTHLVPTDQEVVLCRIALFYPVAEIPPLDFPHLCAIRFTR
jgi:hypothetical protein